MEIHNTQDIDRLKAYQQFQMQISESAMQKENSEPDFRETLSKLVKYKKKDTLELSKEYLASQDTGKSKVPYEELEEDGLITYNGVTYVCDQLDHAICLGDMTDTNNVIEIPLSEGGSLRVNRDKLGDLSKSIGMFSPEDVKRILQAIATDNRARAMKEEADNIEDRAFEDIRSSWE